MDCIVRSRRLPSPPLSLTNQIILPQKHDQDFMTPEMDVGR